LTLLVGYGDYYPTTSLGRAITVVMAIVGTLWAAMITVAFFQYLTFSINENKVNKQTTSFI